MKHRLKITLISIITVAMLAFNSFIPVYAWTQDKVIKAWEESGVGVPVDRGGTYEELRVDRPDLTNQSTNNNIVNDTNAVITEEQDSMINQKKCYHNYVTKVIEPTCIEDGNRTYTCTKCNNKYTEEIPMTEHSYEEKVTKEAICTEVGEVTYICSICEDSYTEGLPATGHTESEWNITKEATCTQAGERIITCADCSETLKTEEIPIIEHTAGSWEIEQKSTLISTGTEVQKCTVCGEILNSASIPINMTAWYIIGGAIVGLAIVILVIVKFAKNK